MKTCRVRQHRPHSKGTLALVISTAALAALSVTAGAGQNALISPSSGYAGVFVLGSPVSRYPTLTRSDCRVPGAPSNEICYSSRNRDFFVGVDAGGSVAAVRTTSPEMFTDRYIRTRYTRMEEVVSRYGVPERIDRNGTTVLFVYGGLMIEAEGGRTSQEIMPKPVTAITLRRLAAARPRPTNQAPVWQNSPKSQSVLARECGTKATTCALPKALGVGEPCSCSTSSGVVYGFAK
jgi:hypothetical protein